MKKTILTVEDAQKSAEAIKVLHEDLSRELGGCTKEELDKVSDETLGLIEVFGDAIIALMMLEKDIVIDLPDEEAS